MAKKTTRPPPNVGDPLSEPTYYRRMWAAYLQRGFNRSQWAAAHGVPYVTVDRWDTGKSAPGLDTVFRAAELTGYTADDFYYGHHKPLPGGGRAEAELTIDAIKALLRELQSAPETIEAFGEYARSAAGQFQTYTHSYVSAWAERHALALREGKSPKDAIELAKVAAANARANTEANAQRLSPPASADELSALGRMLKPAAKVATAPPPAKSNPKRKLRRA